MQLTKDYPNESTEFADEGTVAHWVREQCLSFGFDPYSFIGTVMKLNGRRWTVSSDMADFLQPGIDEIREFDGEMFVEKWVDTTEWVGLDEDGNPQGGTLDCGVVGEHLIVLSDLKYGEGVPVSAVDNDQQILYALAFWNQIARHISEAREFLIIIDQPRNSQGGGYWTISLDDLIARGEKIKQRALAADSETPEFTPGEKQCKWCPAANVEGRIGGCAAHARWVADLIDMDFTDIDNCNALGTDWEPPMVASMTPERLVHIATRKNDIVKWLDYVHAQALQAVIDNGPIAGRKAVLGRRPPRKPIDEGAFEAFLRQKLPSRDPFNKKLKTPSQAEKEIGGKYEIPNALVERGQPKPVLAPVEDSRPMIRAVEDEFDDVD